jgi:mannose-1-phosphate guanylyltransferase
VKALVLAAGRGTRLRPLTDYVPKPMLPVRGTPLLEWALYPLILAGFRDLVIAVSHLADQIEHHFGDGAHLGARIAYSRGAAPAGKAGEIWRARALLPHDEEPYLVIPGDTITDLDYPALMAFHRAHGGPVTVALSTHYRLEVGLADLDPRTARILAWSEKPEIDRPVSTGAYVLSPSVLDAIAPFHPDEREVDLPADVFPALLAAGAPLHGFVGNAAFWDIGRIDDYDRLTRGGPTPAMAALEKIEAAWANRTPRAA